MGSQVNRVKDIITTVLFKAWEDDTFKQELLMAPIASVEKLTGERLPIEKGFNIPMFESSSSEFVDLDTYAYDFEDNVELNDEELNFVSGGVEYHCNSTEDFTNFLKAYL